MTNTLRRATNLIFAFLFAVFSVNLSGVLTIATAHAGSNNGTLKVHEFGTPSGTDSNDPHVCVFNFEGFGLDAGQTGNVTITAQNPTPVITPVVIPLTTDGNGDGSTLPYVNGVGSPYTLANGHYEATLDNKFGTDPGDKAKSKVFWVDCAAATPVTPTAPTSVELCGIANDTYTIPTTTGVDYQIGGNTVTAGTYAGAGSITITAVAQTGYVLQGTTSWTFTFTNIPCIITVTPTAPTKVDLCGTPNDSYTIPTTPGVIYQVGGNTKLAGTYPGTGTVIITAVATPGYTLTGQTTWTFVFNSAKCNVTPAAPTHVDQCGTINDTYTIPTTANVIYKVNGVTKAAGTYAGSGLILVHADAAAGYHIQGQDDWLFLFTNFPCPATPSNPTHVDQCGTANDTYTIPDTIGITYKVNGVTKAAGTYPGSGLIFIDADAKPGYFIPLFVQQHWIFLFSNQNCSVQATTPSHVDQCGTANDTYTIPATTGIVYKVNGNPIAAGTYGSNGSASVTITAEALPGYAITGPTSWIYDFTNAACPAAHITASALCSANGVIVTLTNTGDADGTAEVNGTSIVVPAGTSTDVTVPLTLFKASVLVLNDEEQTLIDQDFDCTPGRGNAGGDTPTVPSLPTTVKTASATTIELPETGANPLVQALTLGIAGITTYGIMFFLVNRRELTSKK